MLVQRTNAHLPDRQLGGRDDVQNDQVRAQSDEVRRLDISNSAIISCVMSPQWGCRALMELITAYLRAWRTDRPPTISDSRADTNATANRKPPGMKNPAPIEAVELTMADARQLAGGAGREATQRPHPAPARRASAPGMGRWLSVGGVTLREQHEAVPRHRLRHDGRVRSGHGSREVGPGHPWPRPVACR